MTLRTIIDRFRAMKHGPVWFERNCTISHECIFEGYNHIYENCFLHACNLGFGTYISSGCCLSLVSFGRYCSIGHRVSAAVGEHPARDFVSTHPAFFSVRKQSGFTYTRECLFDEIPLKYCDSTRSIRIGNDVWIGDNAVILGGVEIGDGAVIAAGTVVHKNVQPYTVVGGSPMRNIRRRFTDSQCDELMRIQWWNRDPEWIRSNARRFCNIEKFLDAERDGL